jgi:hypothetical protein
LPNVDEPGQGAPDAMTAASPSSHGGQGRRVAIVVTVAALAGLGVWLVVRGDDSTPGTPQAATTQPPLSVTGSTRVSEVGLRRLAGALGTPVYWAGNRPGVRYELTETPEGRVYVRYLPKGVAAGALDPYLTVGTYPVDDAFAVTRAAASRPGSVKVAVGAGGVAFYSTSRPSNVYVAFPRSAVQIEVYDPTGETARGLVESGSIRPITVGGVTGDASPMGAVASTRADLRRVSSMLGRQLYWLGRVGDSTVELTRTPDGRVYVRYLAPGVEVGSDEPQLTVATYPLADAFAVTQAAARKPGAVALELPGGAVAFYSKARPTNVYVAFPGIEEQIELFDPSAQRAHQLATSGRIRAVS